MNKPQISPDTLRRKLLSADLGDARMRERRAKRDADAAAATERIRNAPLILQNFAAELYQLLKERSLTKGAFAQLAGVPTNRISAVISCARTPPLAQLERWAALLGLKGKEAEQFVFSGELANATPRVQSWAAKQLGV